MKKIIKSLIEKFPRLAFILRQIRDIKYINHEAKITPHGFKLIGNQQMQMGSFEPHETKLIKKILPKVNTVINVGANIGYYSCLSLKYGKKVIAFEPIELNLKYLYKNIRANGYENNIEIFPIGLSNKTGIVEIYGGGTGASLLKGWAGNPENQISLIPCSTLDNIIGNKLNNKNVLLIVDIEGAEYLFLKGSSQMLNMKPKPIWLVEISVKEHQPKGITVNPNLLKTFELFWSKGYEAVTADQHLKKITKEEIKKIMLTEDDTLGIHNFLFFDKVSSFAKSLTKH